MNADCLKLTVYFGERDRAGGRFLADALVGVFARHELRTSLILRGVEGFGLKHHLRTDRLLTLSEDLPVVAVAVDARDRILAAHEAVRELRSHGLVTLERARMVSGPLELPGELAAGAKLTVYLGRRRRLEGRPAHEAVVDILHRRGIAGATVLLGVDGTAHGVRERAAFVGRNARVPVMVVAVGDGSELAAALPEIAGLVERPLMTLERVAVLKRDGERLGELPAAPAGVRQKLIVYAGEQSRHGGRPLDHQLVRALREAGAAGATTLRGISGYHGDHPPHGDSFWQLRRRVPVVTVVVDEPDRIGRWFAIVDELTDEAGLVTAEVVPTSG